MSRHKQEWVSALLDGELQGPRRWLVVRHVRICPVCSAEYRRQRHVRRMLQENPPAVAMSDPPEFFWSKVKAEIDRRTGEVVSAPVPALSFGDWLRRHAMAVAAAGAAVMIMLGVLGVVRSRPPAAVARTNFAIVEQAVTAIPSTVATVFQSRKADVTVIWVSGLPWTPDMTIMKTLFADLET